MVCTSRKLTAIGFSLWRALTERALSDAAAHAADRKESVIKKNVIGAKVMLRLARQLESIRQPSPVMGHPRNGFYRLQRGKPTLQEVPHHRPLFKNRVVPCAPRTMYYEAIDMPQCDPDARLNHKERVRRRGRLRQSNTRTYFPRFDRARQGKADFSHYGLIHYLPARLPVSPSFG